ncbi:DUF3618 domain-containing protein [Saxibacter everestensis]|uniref:DUF3618 domain-containing protein n=1 Tax=Saxibacter everestensis TaxID=2909229 RepID=A0ABY8QVS3_9MICO|nr:DUF3618 domain-containing protein [Brevibacteriaceae bacterium ZFBP1038]
MSDNPDEIRADIERTQSNLSNDVDAIEDKVNPRSIAHRQTEKVRDAAGNVKDKLFGADSGPGKGGAALKRAASDAPDKIRGKAEGNPLAMGAIAFGAGMLLAALIPASRQEEELAVQIKSKASEGLGDAAKEAADNLREPAQEAATAVKDQVTDSAQTVKDQGASEAERVGGHAQEAARDVKPNN